jgi:predicted transcriptional regulator of viral defense system
MKQRVTELGPLETQLLAYTQFRKKEIVRTGEISAALGITAKQECDLLSFMSKKGIVIRLMRGVYLVPSKIPAGGKFAVSEYYILSKIMEVLKGRYQISGPNAFRFYGFDDQISNKVYVYNNRIYGERNIGSIEFIFIKTSDNRLGSLNKFKTTDGSTAIFASRSRTLMDAVYDWSRYNTIPRAYKWIENDVKKDRAVADDLISVTIKFGNKGTVRRIGYLLEMLGVKDFVLKSMKGKKGSTMSLIPWIPDKPSKGSINKDWGLIINGEI